MVWGARRATEERQRLCVRRRPRKPCLTTAGMMDGMMVCIGWSGGWGLHGRRRHGKEGPGAARRTAHAVEIAWAMGPRRPSDPCSSTPRTVADGGSAGRFGGTSSSWVGAGHGARYKNCGRSGGHLMVMGGADSETGDGQGV